MMIISREISETIESSFLPTAERYSQSHMMGLYVSIPTGILWNWWKLS